MAAPAVTATRFKKSRRVMLRFIPSSRSFIGASGSGFWASAFGDWLLAVSFFYCQFGALESDAAVGAVAKRFVHGAAAAAERKRGLAGEVVLGSVDVDEFD